MADVKLFMYDVIRRPVITEKSSLLAETNKIVFEVLPEATKSHVKAAVEVLFGVSVTSVRVLRVAGKHKRFKGIPGKRADYKKAVVTLAAGQSIDVMSGVS